MSQSKTQKSLARCQGQVEAALEQLTAAQRSLSAYASQALSELESASAKTTYPGLNFATLRDALCPVADLSGQAWLPTVVGTTGVGPWDAKDFDSFLQDRGIQPVDVPRPTITGLVVGVDGWSEEALERQIYGRTTNDLRVYTQELFVLGLVLGVDPYEVLEQAPVDDVGNNHPAIQHILNRDFPWPWPTSTPGDETPEEFIEEAFDWQEESVLKRLGYTARADGPSSKARQLMLAKAFETRELPGVSTEEHRRKWGHPLSARRLNALSRFLGWLIAFQGRDKPEAREKWIEDLDWLRRKYYKSTMSFSWPEVEASAVRIRTRSPNADFMKVLVPSAALAAVIGATPMPRTEVVSRLWSYIKKNRLQDSDNKRMVNADDRLFAIFGKREISMFEMAGLIGRHVK